LAVRGFAEWVILRTLDRWRRSPSDLADASRRYDVRLLLKEHVGTPLGIFNKAPPGSLTPGSASMTPKVRSCTTHVKVTNRTSREWHGGDRKGPLNGTRDNVGERVALQRDWAGVAKRPRELISHPESVFVRFVSFASLYTAALLWR
jgi:hypothetical protein